MIFIWKNVGLDVGLASEFVEIDEWVGGCGGGFGGFGLVRQSNQLHQQSESFCRSQVLASSSPFHSPLNRHLDLSFNLIRTIQNIPATLLDLYLIQNKISIIENLGHLKQLTTLELGGNRIRVRAMFGGSYAIEN